MERRRGFTLVELLVVMAVVAILAAITFGLSRGVGQRQAMATAQAQLAVLSSAIEAYRIEHGTYPVAEGVAWVDNGKVLLRSLLGEAPNAGPVGRAFLSTADFDIIDEGDPEFDPQGGSPPSSDAYIVDPWGEPYVYQYNPISDLNVWSRFGFVLLSMGSDREVALTTGDMGIVSDDKVENADNITTNN